MSTTKVIVVIIVAIVIIIIMAMYDASKQKLAMSSIL